MKTPFGMIPPWMMPPWMMQQEPDHQHGPPDIIVPARVNKAMEFLSMMTAKAMKRPAATENQIEVIDGQTLTTEEESCRATACSLLEKYFAGTLQPDAWENLRVEAIKKQQEGLNQESKLMHCMICGGGKPNPGCPLCDGTGAVMVTPVPKPNQEPPAGHGQVIVVPMGDK